MSNENAGSEYIKVVADIIATEMNLKPSPPSTAADVQRVIIYNQNFVLPTYDYMFIVLSEVPGKVMGVQSTFRDTDNKELQTLIMQREIGIDVMSRNSEARQRKEEVIMALASIYSQQKQEVNGFRIFSYAMSFIDVSENEGAGRINRYRGAINLHVRYHKEKTATFYDTFNHTEQFN